MELSASLLDEVATKAAPNVWQLLGLPSKPLQVRYWHEDQRWTLDGAGIHPPTMKQLISLVYYKGYSEGGDAFKKTLHKALGLQEFLDKLE